MLIGRKEEIRKLKKAYSSKHKMKTSVMSWNHLYGKWAVHRFGVDIATYEKCVRHMGLDNIVLDAVIYSSTT